IAGALVGLRIGLVEGLLPLGAGGVDLAPVEAPLLVRVAQEVVGNGDFLEGLLGLLISRVEVRVQLLRQLAISLLDLVGAGAALHAEDFVRIAHAPPRYSSWLFRRFASGAPIPCDKSGRRSDGLWQRLR